MNKQEAIEKIEAEWLSLAGIYLQDILDIVSQIHEPQKVAIPKFVAEWIVEAEKIHNNLSWVWFSNPACDELNEWLKNHTETFMRAWLDGYTVEKEKLYTVETPNPNTHAHTVLQKTEKGIILISVTNARWRGWWSSKLTESEIKQDFEWAWQWAKQVKEK
jgi:hypothetical protein